MAGRHDGVARKTIKGLLTLYDLHPDFRDVYVEGEWDKRLLDWLFRAAGIKGVVVYDIDAIDIPANILIKHGLPDGKKGRVVALACELTGLLADERQVTCVADRDYDHLLGKSYSSPLLMLTDYSCQEMYFVNDLIIDKFINLVIGSFPFTATQLIATVMPIVQELHLLRAANLSLEWNLSWQRIDKNIDVSNANVEFNHDGFVNRYLNSGGKITQKNVLLAEIARLKGLLTPDPLNHASKSDLFSILAEIFPKFSKDRLWHHPETIARAIAGCVKKDYMLSRPLYVALLNKLRV